MTRWLAPALAAGLAALALGGCEAHQRPSWLSLNPDKWANQRQADEPLTFEIDAPIAVDADTFSGDVIIEADPKARQGRVVFVREALHGYGRSKEAKASLSEITASAELVAGDLERGELGQTLRIRAESSGVEPHFQRAHVYITAPAITHITVRSENGDVRAWHVEGAVDVEAANGNVHVATNRTMRLPVTIINRNGGIEYRVRGESTGKFDAETVNGRVSALMHYGTVIVDSVTSDSVYRATLNEGENRIVLRTTNGDIRIAVVANAEALVPSRDGPNRPPEEPEGERE